MSSSGVASAEVAVCENCGKTARYGIEPECRACYWPHAMYAPNVQIARKLESALQGRFDNTRESATNDSWRPLFEAMVDIGVKSEAVAAVEVNFAVDLFSSARMYYIPYAQQVRGGVRAPAGDTDDAHRRVVDSLIYGGYGEQINFASLSADGRGVPSWGKIFLQLDSAAIGYRSTVLEENSYIFVVAHKLSADTVANRMNVLAGYLAAWDGRHKLVASKLGPLVATMPSPSDLASKIVSAGTGRADADFLEVHIFGPFNHQAVEAVRVLDGHYTQPINAALFAAFKELVPQVTGRPVEMI